MENNKSGWWTTLMAGNESHDNQAKPARRDPARPSIITANLTITGNLVAVGEIQIHGSIKGNINAKTITIGEKGSVTGNIVTDTIDVNGFIMGDISGRTVRIRTTAHIVGDTEHEDLIVEKGACLDGNFTPRSTQ